MNDRSFQLVWTCGTERLVIASAQNETAEFCERAKLKALLLLAGFADDNPPAKAGRPGRSVTIIDYDSDEHQKWVLLGAGHVDDLDDHVFESSAELSRWMGYDTNVVGVKLAQAEKRGANQVKLRGLVIEYITG